MTIRDEWVDGILVNAFPWIDGKNIYLNMRAWKPGGNIEQKPVWEKSLLISLEDEEKLKTHLHSIVRHYAFT